MGHPKSVTPSADTPKPRRNPVSAGVTESMKATMLNAMTTTAKPTMMFLVISDMISGICL